MNAFNIFCTLLGGLGIFYFGMRSTSEVIQAEAGSFIQNSMDSLTKNRFLSLLTGLTMTLLVQSSQAVTFTTLGLVNSGLIPLITALSVVMGANIGTTIMGHIISIPMDKLSLLFVGISFIPTLFSNAHQIRQIGKLIFSIGLLFLGLQIMALGLHALKLNPHVIQSINYFSEDSLYRAFLSLLIGFLVTILLQSSVATIGITITMASVGLIPFKFAFLIVIGMNLGSTIAPLISANSGNVNAKRVALANVIFNFSTGILFFFLADQFITLIDMIIPGSPNYLSEKHQIYPYVGIHIAATHTLFNLFMAAIFAPMLDAYGKMLVKIIPRPKGAENQYDIFSTDNVDDVLPAMALFQAHKEVANFSDIVLEMFKLTDHYLSSARLNAKTFYMIKDFEKKTDNIQREIAQFTRKLVQHRLSPKQSLQSQRAVIIATELENIADYLEKIAVNKTKYHHTIPIDANIMDEILVYSKEVLSFYEEITKSLHTHHLEAPFEELASKAQKLKIEADTIRDDYLQHTKKDEYRPIRDRVLSDITMALRAIRAHIFNIAESLNQHIEDDN